MTPSSSPTNIGQRLAAARLQRGLTQSEVAQRAAIAASYLSRVENDKVRPTFHTVAHIADALEADLTELVGPLEKGGTRRGPCPVTARGTCLLDLIGPEGSEDRYTPREVRLMRRFATWIRSVKPDRVRALEILLEDLAVASEESRG